MLIARSLVVTTALAVSVVMIGSASATVPANAPAGLSIALTTTSRTVQPGSHVTYRVTVTNSGGDRIHGRLELTVPSYLSIERGGTASVHGPNAIWSVRVPPRGSVTKAVSAKVRRIPSGQVSVTTVGSLFLGPLTGAPVIRTAASSAIAGVTAPKPTGGSSRPTASGSRETSSTSTTAWLIGAGAAVVVLSAAGLTFRSRRRRRAEPA